MTTAAQFLAACRAEIGYNETPVNLTKYAAMAHHPNGNAWCETFMVAMARKTGLHLPYYGAYTPAMAQAFKSAGHYGKTPRVGAHLFVYHPELGRIAHTGVVEALHSDGTITTIEGNSNASGSRTGGAVCRVHRSLYNLTFGYPAYTLAAPTTHPNPYPVPVLSTARPYLAYGVKMTASEVKYVQWACGVTQTGTWTVSLTSTVKTFQTHHGLSDDGKVGPKTLTVMKSIRR
jgi:hypothetical protein